MTHRLAAALRDAGFTLVEAGRRAALVDRAATALLASRASPEPASLIWHVPGRIEFLGKHTDYAGGRSLVCATEQGFAIVATPRPDPVLTLLDAGSDERRTVPIRADADPIPGDWGNYALTVASRFARDFPGAWRGADLAFASDLPPAAGVSSSSALVVGVALLLLERNEAPDRQRFALVRQSPEHLAGYLGAVENGRPFAGFTGGAGVGTLGGSQDQTAILCSRAGHLVRYGWDPVRFEGAVPLPEDLLFVIAASGVVAEKTRAALERYNRVSRDTERLWALVRDLAPGLPTLGAALDGGSTVVAAMRAHLLTAEADPERRDRLVRRLDQLARESAQLIPEAADAIDRGDRAALGRAVAASQHGAEVGLGNQIPETVHLVRSAVTGGAVAASAFGAGFGGSVWALVSAAEADRFLEEWRGRYLERFPEHADLARFILTRAAPPAVRLRPSD